MVNRQLSLVKVWQTHTGKSLVNEQFGKRTVLLKMVSLVM